MLISLFRRVIPWTACAILVATIGSADRPLVYCLQGATVVPAPDQLIEHGTVVLRDGLIEAVGAEITPPPDAVIIDGDGLWVYPGLIDVVTTLDEGSGQGAGPPAERPMPFGGGGQSKPSPGPVHPLTLVHPEIRASEELLPFSDDLKRKAERLRELGFTTVLAVPGAGVFRGSSAAVLLKDEVPVSEIILREDVAQHLSFERGRFGAGYPSSLMGTVAAIRQVLLDTQRQEEWAQRYERDPKGMERPDYVASFVTLRDLVAGKQMAVFHADSANDVLLAVRIADEFHLDAAVEASGHEWEVAPEIGQAGYTLILPVAFPEKPKVDDDDEALETSIRDMRRYLEAPANAARLHDAGVRFALTTSKLKTLSDFKKNLGKMLEEGLSEGTALAALTTVPASLLGIEGVAGTLEPGKIANVAVFDGPIFAKDSAARHIFVDGAEYPIEEKKKPKGGDPNATADPRGEWAVVFETPRGSFERRWEIEGTPGSFSGTAETREGTVEFEALRLEGNMLTVVMSDPSGGGSVELMVVITGDSFEGTVEFGPRSVPVKGTRISGPEGGAR